MLAVGMRKYADLCVCCCKEPNTTSRFAAMLHNGRANGSSLRCPEPVLGAPGSELHSWDSYFPVGPTNSPGAKQRRQLPWNQMPHRIFKIIWLLTHYNSFLRHAVTVAVLWQAGYRSLKACNDIQAASQGLHSWSATNPHVANVGACHMA